MYLLNYFYFIVITGLGIKFLFQRYGIVPHPLYKNQWLSFNGPELFWTLTFSTGLLAFSASGVLDLMAVRLLVLEMLCLVGLFVAKHKPAWSTASVCYILYMIWLLIGLFYSPAPIYGFRVIMKYLYPLCIMLFASAVVYDEEVFLKAGLYARWVAVVCLVLSFIPGINLLIPGVFWTGTAQAIHFISMCIYSFALFYDGGYKKVNFYLGVLFMIPCVLWVFRTSIMGTTLALLVFFFFKYKLKSLPIIVACLLVFIVVIFCVPSIKEKMFNDGKGKNIEELQNGNISTDDINSNGRFAMWEWSLNKFYRNKELIGTGTGNLQEIFYALRHPFGSIRICHNDYVQILCDNGVIGICLFGGSFLFLIFHSFRVYQNKCYGVVIRICAITAGSSAAGTLLTMYTDNVINYTMATLSYPCGFYGMMLGLIAGTKMKKYAI